MKSRLEKLRHTKYVGVAELAREAAEILAESGLAQDRGTVTELPDERTVRYYISEGLVPPAEDKQGTASVFGHRHLLQLLVVKKLQAEHLPIRKIRDLVEGRTERELERLLGTESATDAKNEALSYLEKLLTSAPRPTPQAIRLNAAASSPPKTAHAAAPDQQANMSSAGTWSRIEIEPGLELHVHDQYQPPRETKGLRRLAQLLLRIIESHGHRPRKRGS